MNKCAGKCAQVVREAIEAATGVALVRQESAKDYGSSLIKAGFKVVTDAPKAGDVAIYGAIDKHPDGHMQVYTGSKWLSDFVQTDQYPGPNYRNAKAKYTLYRLG